MNMRTALGKSTKFLINRSADVDEKLAFIDRVCAMLIESRCGSDHYYSSLCDLIAVDNLTTFECMTCQENVRPFILKKIDLDIESLCDRDFTPPQTARPAALVNRCSSPATRASCMGVRGNVSSLIELSQPRGSPNLLFVFDL